MSTRQEVYKLIIEKKDNKEIAAALNISVRTVERYRKECDSDKRQQKKEKGKSKSINRVGRNNKRGRGQIRTI